MDLDKIATKGFSSELSSTRSHKKDILPQRLCKWIFSMLFWTPQGNALAKKNLLLHFCLTQAPIWAITTNQWMYVDNCADAAFNLFWI